MLPVLLQSLLLASSGLISVGSITLVILLLISDRGWRNGLGYALGYTSAYTVIGILVTLLGVKSANSASDEPSGFASMLLIVLGILLLGVAYRNWRKALSGKPSENEEPRFFAVVDKMTPLRSFGFGALVSVINFKNLALFLTALSVAVISELAVAQKIVIALLVAFVFCLSVIIPVGIYLIFPKGAKETLGGIKDFLNRHSRAIGIYAPLFFGLIFWMKGITDLL